MPPFAIRAENLGKQYRLGADRGYKTLRDGLATFLKAPARWLRARKHQADATFWALRDINFTVNHGEVLGIIGRNGAGKSTLLKILSRITGPTTGALDLHGRVGSLLEVGTGFHAELSGRENIYLNGAILGMRHSEIRRKFDEIVAFAGVEKFLDTAVKHYSSGMYMRLAFAVAAHLDTEILLVDEVLAVGDAQFQRKCLNKMEQVGKQGRTVLFISHSMPAITRLCQRAILLDEGKVALDGPAHDVAKEYLHAGTGSTAARVWPDPARAPGNHIARLRGVRIRNENGETTAIADIRHPVGIEMEFDVLAPDHVLIPNFHLYNDEGICVFITGDNLTEWRRKPRPTGKHRSVAWIPGNYLAEGTLFVGAAVSTMVPVTVHCWEPDAVAFQVMDYFEGDSARGDYAGVTPGVVRPLLDWTNSFTPTL